MATKKGYGYPRTKSRAQAQQEIPYHQEWWTGGENSDSPASAIGLTECAIVENVISHGPAATTYRALKFSSKGFQRGRQGTRIVSKVALPGSGTEWSRYQNPITRQWLLHRGSDLWISSDSTCTAWTQIFKAANDGATAYDAGSIHGNNGDITKLLLRGQNAGNTFPISPGIGRLYWSLLNISGVKTFSFYKDLAKTQLVAQGSTLGESGTVFNPHVTYTTIPISCDYMIGALPSNTDSGVLYYNFTPGTDDGNPVLQLFLYDDPSKPEFIAMGEIPVPPQVSTTAVINNAAGLITVKAVYGGTLSNTNAGTVYWDLVFNPWNWQVSGTTDDLLAVCWSGTQYVAVSGNGTDGTIYTSPDAITWTPQVSGTANVLRGVTFGNGLYVAVGDAGTILTSVDGVAWTTRVSNAMGAQLNSVTTISGIPIWVAVGESGIIVKSTDGTTWTSVGPGGGSLSLKGIDGDINFPNPAFVAVGFDGSGFPVPKIYTSSDGTTWNSISPAAGGSAFSSVTSKGSGGTGFFCAVGDVIQTSTDFGTTWTTQSQALANSNNVKWTGSQLVAVGNSAFGAPLENIQTSPDGVTWTAQYSGYNIPLFGVAVNGSTVIVVGSSGIILSKPTVPNTYGFNVYSDSAKTVLVAQLIDLVGNTPAGAGSKTVSQINASGLSLAVGFSSLATQPMIVSSLSTITNTLVTGMSTLIVQGDGLYGSFQVPNLLQGADEAPGNEITGLIAQHAGVAYIAQQNGSGVGGYSEFAYTADQNSPDDYVDVNLDSDFVNVQSRIRCTVNDFVVSTSMGLFYVATATNIFYKISPQNAMETTGASYPFTRPADSGASSQATQCVRQYVTTFVRLESSPGVPSYDGNRNTRELKFESASTQADSNSVDYTIVARALPPSAAVTASPWIFYFQNNGVFPELQAAGHYTHAGIYSCQTLNYINPLTQLAANASILVWEGDIPLTQGFVIDDLDDPTLAGRISANEVLETRGYQNIGSSIAMDMDPARLYVRNDLKPTNVFYSIPADPAYFGFNFPTQFHQTDAPALDVARVGAQNYSVLCKSLTYVSDPSQTQQLSQQTSVLIITQFPKIDPALGIKEWNAFAFTNQSTIMALCSDNTIKELNGTAWGADITYLKIGNVIKLLQAQPIFQFINSALYMFYRLDATKAYNNLCYRFGFGGQAGSGWSRITGIAYPFPALGFGSTGVGVDETDIPRLYLVDRATNFMHITENFPDGAVWKDSATSVYVGSASGAGASFITNINIVDWPPAPLFASIIRGITPSINLFASADDRQNNTNIVGRITALGYDVENLNAPIVPEAGQQIGGTVDVGVIPSNIGPPILFNITFSESPVQVGTDIIPRIRFKETVGPREGWTLYHHESRYHIRPADNSGYLSEMVLTANVYADGAATPSDTMTPVPIAGAVQYGDLAQGQRVQTEFISSTSAMELVSMDTLFLASDISPLPQAMGNNIGYQQALQDSLLYWNVKNIQQDRASSVFYVYPNLAPNFVLGPDGCVDALATRGLIVLSNALSAPRWIQFWTDAALGHDIVRLIGAMNVGISIYTTDIDTILAVTIYGGDTFNTNISSIAGWNHFAVEFTGTAINIYQNSVLVGTAATTDVPPAATQTVIDPDNVGMNVFDILIKGNSLSQGALTYYYNNVLAGGQDVIPLQ